MFHRIWITMEKSWWNGPQDSKKWITGRNFSIVRIFHNLNGNQANRGDLIDTTGLVISNWIQTVNFSARVTLKFDGWPRKTIGHFYTVSSFVHHFKFVGEFKLLQSGNAQFGSKLAIFCHVWPWNLTNDIEKQFSKRHQALCIISSPYVKSNWSCSPETAKWGHDLCDLDL